MNENKSPETDVLVKRLQDSLERARQQDDPSQVCLALTKLGQAYLDKREVADALAQFEAALKIARQTEDKEIQARLFGFKGMALNMLGNYAMAMQFFKKSNGIASHLGHNPLLCDSFFQIGLLEFEMGNTAKALEDISRALEIADQESDGKRIVKTAGALADKYYALETYDKALAYYGQAYDQARNMGNHKAECLFLTEMGNASLAKGEAKVAIQQYDHALNIASAIEDRGAEINIIGGLFRANASIKEVGLAVYYGEKVIQLAGEIKHFDAQMTNIHALATFMIDQARYEKALAYLDRGRELATQNDNQEWLLAIEVAAGTAWYHSGENAAAHKAYTRALNLARGFADKSSEAKILGYLGAVRAEQGMLAESIEYAQQSLALAQELEETGLAGEQQMMLAFNFHDIQNQESAVQYCQAAVASYKAIEAADMLKRAEEFLAELQG